VSDTLGGAALAQFYPAECEHGTNGAGEPFFSCGTIPAEPNLRATTAIGSMKKVIVFLLVICALYVLGKYGHMNLGLLGKAMGVNGDTSGQGGDARAIPNPVYAEVRLHAEIHDRTFNAVLLAKTFDQADCIRGSADVVDRMTQHQDPNSPLQWQLMSSECGSTLESRNLRLFDNKPTFVNYLSVAPNDASQREVRLIIWGVTADEGNLICDDGSRLQEKWKGATVTCIHALPSE
jgi:hypothetical protein